MSQENVEHRAARYDAARARRRSTHGRRWWTLTTDCRVRAWSARWRSAGVRGHVRRRDGEVPSRVGMFACNAEQSDELQHAVRTFEPPTTERARARGRLIGALSQDAAALDARAAPDRARCARRSRQLGSAHALDDTSIALTASCERCRRLKRWHWRSRRCRRRTWRSCERCIDAYSRRDIEALARCSSTPTWKSTGPRPGHRGADVYRGHRRQCVRCFTGLLRAPSRRFDCRAESASSTLASRVVVSERELGVGAGERHRGSTARSTLVCDGSRRRRVDPYRASTTTRSEALKAVGLEE